VAHDQVVVTRTFGVTCLSSTAWTALCIAAEDVQLALRDAVVARLSIYSPVFLLLAVSNALKDLATDAECRRNSISVTARV
jgi:hypothetical protein